MDLTNLYNNQQYFENHGFKLVADLPIFLESKYVDFTKPECVRDFELKTNDDKRFLLASGEQAFLEWCQYKKMGKYMGFTPCFRNEQEDDLHKQYFLKNEIFINADVNNETLGNLIDLSIIFFKNLYREYLSENVKILLKEIPAIKASVNYDIIIEINDEEIELGSYGIRTFKSVPYIYGTGCAEPRTSYVLNKLKNNFSVKSEEQSGYHLSAIPKGILGEFSKIEEEFLELKDANKQKNKLLELCEMSDLLGAIKHYANKYNISMEELLAFNKLTEQAFKQGKR